MKKIVKRLLLMAFVLVAAIGVLAVKVLTDARKQAEDQAMMAKTDEELIGRHFFMPRQDKEPVDMNLYLLDGGENYPLVLNIHGGAFIAGDADTLDSQSDRISKAWNVCVAAVNYQLAKPPMTLPTARRKSWTRSGISWSTRKKKPAAGTTTTLSMPS